MDLRRCWAPRMGLTWRFGDFSALFFGVTPTDTTLVYCGCFCDAAWSYVCNPYIEEEATVFMACCLQMRDKMSERYHVFDNGDGMALSSRLVELFLRLLINFRALCRSFLGFSSACHLSCVWWGGSRRSN